MKHPPVDRTVLVTGCSSGIGLATALWLRDRGWTVAPTARSDRDLDALRGRGFDPVRLDLADSASVQAAAAETLRRFDGRPGALVNNAGFGQPGALEDLSRDALHRQFEVNVFGLQELTNLLVPAFRRNGRGRIVHVSSVLGRICLPFMGAYTASKYAVEALGDALRMELRGSGVAVSIVEPGPIATAFGNNAEQTARTSLPVEGSVFAAVYREQMEHGDTRRRDEDAFRAPPEAVARAIAHALTSPHPRRRYPITAVARLGALMARFAPAAFIDALMTARQRRHYRTT